MGGPAGPWLREPGVRIQASRPLDSSKLQAPGVVALPEGGFRLFYTAVGPAKPFPACQGYILSAVSDDGLTFRTEPGIRLAPDPRVLQRSLRVIAPTVTRLADGRWRMYLESRGPAAVPTVIASAVSSDLLAWTYEDGIRLEGFRGVGGCRYLSLPDGRGRLYVFAEERLPGRDGTDRRFHNVVSAVTSDGLRFEWEPGYRLQELQAGLETAGITAAEVIAPADQGDRWTMFYSAWQDVPEGTVVPVHPSADPDAEANGRSVDFAAASIAADMAGYRSRIFTAFSDDGLAWERGTCVIAGDGPESSAVDSVHAEDMSLVGLEDGRYRMYYAACDNAGNWRIASAITAS